MADGVVVPLREPGKAKKEKPEVEKYRRMFDEAREALQDTRNEADIDRDYYDGKQWTPEERRTLERRKQPVQTYNLTRVAINGMVGIVERSQTDPKAWPKNAPDEQSADIATKTLRYVAEQNNLDRLKVRSARDFFIEGVAVCIIEAEEEQPDYAIKIKRVPWKEFFFDPYSQEENFSDARYMGIAKWMDSEDIKAMYPEHEEDIEGSYEGPIAQDATFEDRPNRAWADRRRKRLMIVEMYHREKGTWSRCVFVRGGVLDYGPSPYMDENQKPICPIEAVSYAKDRDNMPYGAVRDLRSPQDGYNRRQSKLLHMLNVRQTFGTKSAVQDVDAVKRELAKPDGHVEVEFGKFGDDFGVIPQNDQVAGQFQLLMEARAQMERLLPSKGLTGRQEQGNSGKAIGLAQDAGMTELADPFGGLTDWELRILRQCWARCKQFWTGPRWIRVSDDLGAPQFVQVNEPVIDEFGQPVIGPDGQPQMKSRLAEAFVDITIDTTNESPTMKEAQFGILGEMVKMGLPIPPEAIIEASDLRNKAQIVEKIGEMRQQQAQQPNPEMEKLKLEAAKSHEAQNIERERLQQDATFKAQEAELEVRRMEAELRKAQIDSEIKAVELQIKQQELGLKAQEMDLRRLETTTNLEMQGKDHELEREKLTDGQTARREAHMAERMKASTDDDEREDIESEMTGKPSRTDRLIEAMTKQQAELVSVLTRPKRLVRGPDGRAVGVE